MEGKKREMSSVRIEVRAKVLMLFCATEGDGPRHRRVRTTSRQHAARESASVKSEYARCILR